MKEEKIPNTRKSHQRVCGEFWNLGGQHNWEGKKKEPTDHGRVALTLTSAGSKRGLNREASAACIGWGPGLNALWTI